MHKLNSNNVGFTVYDLCMCLCTMRFQDDEFLMWKLWVAPLLFGIVCIWQMQIECRRDFYENDRGKPIWCSFNWPRSCLNLNRSKNLTSFLKSNVPDPNHTLWFWLKCLWKSNWILLNDPDIIGNIWGRGGDFCILLLFKSLLDKWEH